MATDKYRKLATEVDALSDDALLFVLAGGLPLVEAETTRAMQARIAYAPQPRTAAETAALEGTLLAYRKGTLDVRAEILSGADPSTLLDGLTSYFRLSDLTDSHGSNDLSNPDGVTFGPGKLGDAAIFSGLSTASLEVASIPTPGSTGNGATISLWFRTNLSFSGITVLMGERTSSNPSFRIQVAQSTGRALGFWRVNGQVLSASPPDVIGDSLWHHFVMRYMGESGRYVFAWMDGVQIASSASEGFWEPTDDQGVGWEIGASAGGSGFGQNSVAEVDEVGVWERPLTYAEIAELFGAGAPPSYPF